MAHTKNHDSLQLEAIVTSKTVSCPLEHSKPLSFIPHDSYAHFP